MKVKLREATEHQAVVYKYFRGLADPTRLTILQLLAEKGELTVGELVGALGIPQARVSAHLGCLKWCRFVKTRRQGKFIHYSLGDPRLLQILILMQALAREHAAQVEKCPVLEREEEEDVS